MRPRLAILALLTGCVTVPPPAVEKETVPVPTTCPPPPPTTKPVWPDQCAEDWYAEADLPACVKDWIVELSAQQKKIAKKQNH